ncbi:MAG: hypothetical protein AAGA68_00415 [Pseudomonadota bacterium]
MAIDAVHRLEHYADLAQKTEAIGKHFDTIDKLGKALEIAQAVERTARHPRRGGERAASV